MIGIRTIGVEIGVFFDFTAAFDRVPASVPASRHAVVRSGVVRIAVLEKWECDRVPVAKVLTLQARAQEGLGDAKSSDWLHAQAF